MPIKMMNQTFVKLTVPTEDAMLALGKQLALACGDTAIIFLKGQLGAGKTTLTRGFMRGLGFKGHVKSPTYTLVEPYELSQGMVYHFDFYRVKDSIELEYMGIQDYFISKAICLIEWPEYGADRLHTPDLACYIEPTKNGRTVKIVPQSKRGETILNRFERNE